MNSIKQTAEKLGVSDKTVRKLVSSGQLEHHRIGLGRGQIRISNTEIEAYLERTKRERFEMAPAAKHRQAGLKHLKL